MENIFNDKDFKIIGNALVKYNGKNNKIVIPNGITSIGQFSIL